MITSSDEFSHSGFCAIPQNMRNGITLYRERAGLTKAELARRAGISPQQLGRMENNRRKLSRKWANMLAPVLNCTPQELMFPDAALVDTEKYSAIYDLLEDGGADSTPLLSISHSLFQRMVPSARLHRLQVMFVDSDDVSSHTKRGDALIVDLDDNEARRPGIYAVNIQGEPQWRRLSVMTTGMIRVTSDDPAVEDEVVKADSLTVIGRAKLRISAI